MQLKDFVGFIKTTIFFKNWKYFDSRKRVLLMKLWCCMRCMLGNFSCYSCCLLTLSKINFKKNLSGALIVRVSNGLDPDQDRHYVRPDLGIDCLQS